MDTKSKIEIRNSFVADADIYLRTAEEQIKAAQGHVTRYTMGCEREIKAALEQLEIARKTLWQIQRSGCI